MFVQSCICQASIKNNSTSFSFWVNVLLTLILQLITSHFFVNITLPMEVAINITVSQSSIIITCFHHVAHQHSSKKVKGVLAGYLDNCPRGKLPPGRD